MKKILPHPQQQKGLVATWHWPRGRAMWVSCPGDPQLPDPHALTLSPAQVCCSSDNEHFQLLPACLLSSTMDPCLLTWIWAEYSLRLQFTLILLQVHTVWCSQADQCKKWKKKGKKEIKMERGWGEWGWCWCWVLASVLGTWQGETGRFLTARFRSPFI